jgi:hypothetical protein
VSSRAKDSIAKSKNSPSSEEVSQPTADAQHQTQAVQRKSGEEPFMNGVTSYDLVTTCKNNMRDKNNHQKRLTRKIFGLKQVRF